MKSKSFIVALLTISTLGLTTSCADMFDVDSTRVVYEKDHNLDSTADSAYTTLGVLQCMQQIADRYVILGEVRGDLCEINENTKTSLRNLANFNFDEENEYLDVKDYYAIINNCNYALAKMDTTLAINNKRVMVDEYAALLSIRAWTYLQLAINYDKVPFYTEPVTTMAELEKVAGDTMDIKGIAEGLINHPTQSLLPYLDYEMPYFSVSIPQNLYPVMRLVVAELYLWSGDYVNAIKYYEDYLMRNKKFKTEVGSGDDKAYFNGFVSLAGTISTWDGQETKPGRKPFEEDYYTVMGGGVGGYENLSYIQMSLSNASGMTSELPEFFNSFDNTHYLYPSTYWKELSDKQVIFNAKEDKDGNVTSIKSSSIAGGDMRKDLYYMTSTTDGEEFGFYMKHVGQFVVYQRRSITYLRYAEAMNALACELDKAWEASGHTDTLSYEGSRMYAKHAFYMLKDAYQVFFPEGSELREDYKRFEKELQKKFVGVHARGTGPVYLDKDSVKAGKLFYEGVYVLDQDAIAKRFEMQSDDVQFSDTLNYVDELIIDELALEATLEGNRFGDLVRFALRRGEPEFLAKRVASRKGQEEFDQELYDKLLDVSNWYLPKK